jgi:signal transduction histidine kinase
VLSNLIRNARQALTAAGQGGAIKVAAHETETAWVIDLSDNGPGLPAKAQAHLFTPFQGGARKGGSGLGLAIASELVKGHGGQLQLLKTDAEGTSFRLTLPKGDGTV